MTEAVLTEVGNSLARCWRHLAVGFIEHCHRTPNVHVVTISPALHEQAVALYKARTDKTWGLTDCLSFVVMEAQHLRKALTCDDHFVQAGFRALLLEEAGR